MIEMRIGSTAHRGKVFAKDSRSCWLTGADGAITKIPLDAVTSFRKLGAFRPVSPSVLGDQLAREYGRDYEVSKTREYVVVAPRGRARMYANLFNKTYRTFTLYFRVRNFDVPRPEYPLVAIVFATRAEFDAYCARENVRSSGFSGFYLGGTNRIVSYEHKARTAARGTGIGFETDAPQLSKRPWEPRFALGRPVVDATTGPMMSTAADGSIDEATEGVLIHEATHQLGYNCGLHARLGWNPKWTVEGLATLFEAPGIRNSSSGRLQSARVNPGRLRDMRDYLRQRPKDSLVDLVGSDRRLQTAVADFYAESWALTFFLVETRPREYAAYQRAIAARDPFRRYTADERLEDFRKAFGGNLPLLDAEFVRFLARLD